MDNQSEQGLKILIVDDDRDLLETLSLVLSSCGHDVTSASSGSEGIRLLKAGKYDVILVDLRMPRMNGHQVLRFAKLVEPECKVIMMSAYASAEAVVKAIREDVYDYLLKPFKLEELQDILRKASKKTQSSVSSRKV